MKESRFFQPKVPIKQKIALVLFGVFLFFVLLETGLRLGGFILLSMQEQRNLQSIKQKGTYRILCLGESTTQGQYPRLLEEALNQHNIGVRFSVLDKGRSATNTSVILSQIESYLNEYHPDMVVTMMGINDHGEHIPFEGATTSKGMLLIRSFRTYKLIRLLWLHILNKDKEIRLYKPNEDRNSSGKDKTYPLGVELKESLVESISTEELLKKAMSLNPKNSNAYVELGWFYERQRKLPQAEELLKKAIDLNPKNGNAYFELGKFYGDQDRFVQAEELLKKAIDLNPKNGDTYKDGNVYIELGWIYRRQGKLPQAEYLFKKFIDLSPKDDRAYGALLSVYEEINKPELAKEYAEKVNRLRMLYYNLDTVNNYRKLKKILDRKEIKLVCVQYPMRNIKPLKKIFEGDSKGIIFVDNERIFRHLIRQDNSYFRDMFAGDFGHCTEKGNRILAQNIATAILKEVFK